MKNAWPLLCLTLLCWPIVYGQQQRYADSLEIRYLQGRYTPTERLGILLQLAKNSADPDKILAFSDILIHAAQEADSVNYLFSGYLEKGNALQMKGNLSSALESYFTAAKLASRKNQFGAIYNCIANVYSITGNHGNAQQYYQKAIPILKEEKDSLILAGVLFNLGDEYLKTGKPDSALAYTRESQTVYNRLGEALGAAYCTGNFGKIYAASGNDAAALLNLNAAIAQLESLGQPDPLPEYYLDLSKIHYKKGDAGTAIRYARKSLELAQQNGQKKEIGDASAKLSEYYEHTGNAGASLVYYKAYIQYRDSVNNIKAVQDMANLRADFEISQKQKEVDLLATRNKLKIAERNGFIWASLFLVALLLLSIYFYTQKVKRNKVIAARKMQEAEIAYQKELIQSVITSQEAERKRIGADLHDEVGSALSTLRLMIERFTTAAAEGDKKVFGSETKLAIDRIVANTRGIAHDLSPITGGAYGFLDALEELLDRVNQFGKMEAALTLDSEQSVTGLSNEVALNIYRVLSELVNNTGKHAAARHIALDISRQNGNLCIQYEDDGVGMAQPAKQKGIGLHNIESRLGMLNAQYTVTTSAGNGYKMQITLPVQTQTA